MAVRFASDLDVVHLCFELVMKGAGARKRGATAATGGSTKCELTGCELGE